MKFKNIVKNSISLLLAHLLIISLPFTALATDSTVTYEAGKLTVFQPGSIYSDSDLFNNLKGVMPGDVRTEEITIQNKTNDYDYIKVYLRAIVHDGAGNPISDKVLTKLRADQRRQDVSELDYMHDFLSQLSMKVWKGETLIYEESPDQVKGLTDNVYLSKLSKGDTVKLSVELNVPVELDNKYSGRIGEVDWVFVIEGFDNSTPPSPSDDHTMLTVNKVWVDDGIGRPDSVTVHLLRDGKFHKKIELNQGNQWNYTWNKLNDHFTWSVVEVNIPGGYEAIYSIAGNTTTITNTEKSLHPGSSDSSDLVYPLNLSDVKKIDENSNTDGVATVTNMAFLIQTGQLSWPILVMGGLGLVLIIYGLIMVLKKRNDHA